MSSALLSSSRLQPIVEQHSLRWIFVGGKGGVGKTTTSCSLALAIAKERAKLDDTNKVLLISTDPAHSTSDALNQKLNKHPTQVTGIANLYAMEIDPTVELESSDVLDAQSTSQLSELLSAVPGIDEAMSFASIMNNITKFHYNCIIFDTAPTGHTLRLLSFPSVLNKAFEKLEGIKQKFGPMLSQLSAISGSSIDTNKLMTKLDETRKTVDQINEQFGNADLTTFIAVCIPEFLSLYETERLIQNLSEYSIDVHAIVVNQVLMTPKSEEGKCKRCTARQRMQNKYLQQIDALYSEDFSVVKMPLLLEEVRGVKALQVFSDMLVKGVDVEHLDQIDIAC